MPVVPTMLERAAFRAKLAPGAVVDLYGTASLHAASTALELGAFEALAEPHTAGELADAIDADERGLTALLDVLVASGYLRRERGTYRATPGTRRWLTDAEGTNLGPWLRFWTEVVLPYWRSHVDRAVREGHPGETLYEWLGDDEAGWRRTQEGFRAASSLLAVPVCDALGDVGGARVLDLGGGHGAYAVELARRGAEVTLVDAPAALGVARDTVAEADVGDRVTLRGADYLTADLGDDYDLVLLFNVLHGHDDAECERVLGRAAAALAPGGRVAVLDQFAGDASLNLARVGLAVIDLTYLVTLGGRTHERAAADRWLADAGFGEPTETTFRRSPGVRLLVAERR